VESLPILVVKKDGSRQPYEREKVQKGILRACEKRNVSVEQLEALVDSIEAQIYNSLEREITTEFIGEMVMDKLRIWTSAYVRFASVYRHFKDINTFMSELNKLLEKK
jgi:transcriptional repressor NrdR